MFDGANFQFIDKKNLYCIFNKILIKIANFLFFPINWKIGQKWIQECIPFLDGVKPFT